MLAPPHGVLSTGSNMSGKSTFLRTVAINVVLAQTINTCLATTYEAPVYQVRSCIGRAELAATHDGELVDLLRGSYDVCHFGDAVGPEGLLFDYRLTPGPATSRNAIALLELNGAPESVVRRALDRAAALDRQRQQ